ncbi:DUF4371 domain-containing protein [Nephila pilipes]|uniref:DUF4371 domain-containing protein n=1 Tax=Nephila pilipes TaxID=299642 RepID=A0A8X6MZL5_NEPPI|nr:DUF4371 domain-containing protein [Nephila pilipes]
MALKKKKGKHDLSSVSNGSLERCHRRYRGTPALYHLQIMFEKMVYCSQKRSPKSFGSYQPNFSSCYFPDHQSPIFTEYRPYEKRRMLRFNWKQDTMDGEEKTISSKEFSERYLKGPCLNIFFVSTSQEQTRNDMGNLTIGGRIIDTKGKPFIDDGLIKSRLLIAAEDISSEKRDLFLFFGLSVRTIVRRTEDIGSYITCPLIDKPKQFKWFSKAFDELTNITDAAQRWLFIRGINTKSEVIEELAYVCSLFGTTTSADMFKKVEEVYNGINYSAPLLLVAKICEVPSGKD